MTVERRTGVSLRMGFGSGFRALLRQPAIQVAHIEQIARMSGVTGATARADPATLEGHLPLPGTPGWYTNGVYSNAADDIFRAAWSQAVARGDSDPEYEGTRRRP